MPITNDQRRHFPDMSQLQCDVAIIGGGLGGLALAVGLQRRGHDVRLFEVAPELRTATSTLIGLGGNSFTALEWLHPSIVPTFKERGVLSTGVISMARSSKGQPVEHVLHRPSTSELYGLRWSEVQSTLAALLSEDSILCNHRATGYTEEQGWVTVHFQDKPDVRARLVVGADGVRSAIRACMLPEDPGPRYLGHMNWNALLFNPDNSVLDIPRPGQFFAMRNGTPQTWTINGFVIDAGSGYTFWQCRVQSDTPAFTPSPDQQPGSPSSRDEQALVDAAPHLVGGGLGKPGSKARIIQLLEEEGDVFEHLLKAVKATPEADIFERAMLDRLPLDELCGRMSSQGGRVVLLGDAAHAMHSGPGQGGRTAFEDAHTLALALEQHRSQLYGWASAASKQPTAAAAQPGIVSPVQGAMAVLTLDSRGQDDAPALSQVVKQYEQARLVRTCRLQRYAAEGGGLASLRQSLRERALGPGPWSDEDLLARGLECSQWMNQYPDNPQGDPASRFWKPPAADGTT